MGPALYTWRSTRRRAWRSTFLVVVLCGLLGAVALAALAGARRTESAYSRYLASVHASDVMVNIPVPNLVGVAASQLPARSPLERRMGGLNAFPIVHGRIDDAFTDDNLTGSLGDGFTQDRMTVLEGRLPSLGSDDQIALTPRMASLFGVGIGGTVSYRFVNGATYRITYTGDTELSRRRDCRHPSRARRPVRPGVSRRAAAGGHESGARSPSQLERVFLGRPAPDER